MILYKGKLKGGFNMKKNYLKRQKRTVYFILIFILTSVLLLTFFLNTYLLNLQRKERLQKINDYTEYELLYEPQKRCQLKNKFVFEGYTYVFSCVDEVYLSYGSTKMTLEEALENKYLTFKDLTLSLTMTKNDMETIYTHHKSKTSSAYCFVLNEEAKTITFKGEDDTLFLKL